jgi:hypothetical protein
MGDCDFANRKEGRVPHGYNYDAGVSRAVVLVELNILGAVGPTPWN